MRRALISYDRLRAVLHYDPLTGIFTWLARTSNRICVGDVAGSARKNGYLRICIDSIIYRAHQLAWFYMTGAGPVKKLDHIDLDKLNNRWRNIRLATKSQNAANSRIRIDNTSGFKGVSWHRGTGKWVASIQVNVKAPHLGLFSTRKEAHVAYCAAAKKYFGEFARAA